MIVNYGRLYVLTVFLHCHIWFLNDSNIFYAGQIGRVQKAVPSPPWLNENGTETLRTSHKRERYYEINQPDSCAPVHELPVILKYFEKKSFSNI